MISSKTGDTCVFAGDYMGQCAGHIRHLVEVRLRSGDVFPFCPICEAHGLGHARVDWMLEVSSRSGFEGSRRWTVGRR